MMPFSVIYSGNVPGDSVAGLFSGDCLGGQGLKSGNDALFENAFMSRYVRIRSVF